MKCLNHRRVSAYVVKRLWQKRNNGSQNYTIYHSLVQVLLQGLVSVNLNDSNVDTAPISWNEMAWKFKKK